MSQHFISIFPTLYLEKKCAFLELEICYDVDDDIQNISLNMMLVETENDDLMLLI